ncbi:hypothetical protein PHMEG_00013586 [Phytophthora megakarya]|uniref:Uncharacterized protein n=1 Tax=Phytophthora megakarya TaxID=4795 RepID=A0A225W8I6_9STRA|nr:hypothetical protein PHMEG_00013586 [Phytophthora megakarya]
MQSHINELEDKADVLSRLQRPIDDAEKCLQMLDSLPSTWSNLVTVCQNQESLIWPTLQAKLLLEADNSRRTTGRPGQTPQRLSEPTSQQQS